MASEVKFNLMLMKTVKTLPGSGSLQKKFSGVMEIGWTDSDALEPEHNQQQSC